MALDVGKRSVQAPRVSVIVPTYNRAADVRRCLEALVAQTYREFEVLVCDDGSTDDTGRVVESFTSKLDVSYYWAENFGGPARSRNNGVRQARAEYVAFLDSDDWWAPRKLERSVRALDAGADVVYHDMFIVSSPAQKRFWRRSRTRALRSPAYDDLMTKGNGLATSSVVMRRELLLKIGGFSEERGLIAWEDFDAWLRIARHTEKFERLAETLGYYWSGGGNISTPRRLIDNLAHFKKKYGAEAAASRRARMPAWYHYLLGRAHYTLGAHHEVPGEMRQALLAGLPGSLKAKAAYFATMSSLRRMMRP